MKTIIYILREQYVWNYIKKKLLAGTIWCIVFVRRNITRPYAKLGFEAAE